MKSLKRFWNDLSISKKLYCVVGIMATLMIGELVTLRFAMRTLSAARALVGGEGLWSKAQKNAHINLQHYSATKNERDYKLFLENLKVPDGDHIARIELSKKNPDYAVVTQGFRQGEFHPEDIPPTIDLIRRFYWVAPIERAIGIWTEGDKQLALFKKAASDLRQAVKTKNNSQIASLNLKLKKINNELTQLQNDFSYELGRGSRWLESVVLTALSIAVFIIESIGLFLAFLTSRSISQGLRSITTAANAIGQGQFNEITHIKSNDEVGQLAQSVNHMGQILQKSYRELETKIQVRTAELENSKKQLDIILKGITDGITVIDENGKFVFVNEMGAKMCGFDSVEDFLATPQKELMSHFEIMDEFGNPFPLDKLPSRLVFQGNDTPPEVTLRFRLKKKDEERWALVKSSPVYDEVLNRRLVVTIFKDFTEHKRTEDSLKFLDAASRVLTSSLDYKKTLQTLAQLAVPHVADWCVIDIIEEEGKPPIRIATAHNDPDKLLWALDLGKEYPQDWDAPTGAANVIRTGKSEIYSDIPDDLLIQAAIDERHLNILRELRLKSVMIVPLSSRNKLFGVLTMISSKLEYRYTAKDLILAEELARRAGVAIDNNMLYLQAQKAIQARDAFLSIASHELKTPLTSLSLQIQMTQRNIDIVTGKIPPVEKIHKVFDTSAKLVDRLTSLVEDLLDASRIQTGKFSFNFGRVNLSEIVHDMAARFSGQLAKVGCKLEVRIQENILGNIDSTRIEQVIDNLITNIIKYAAGSTVKVILTGNHGIANLIIEDDGPGIPLEKQDKIFERFERANVSPTTPGLGLGLFIVKEIMKGHHGSISLKSDTNQGTRFTLELPLEENKKEKGFDPSPSIS